jgi:acetyltransferase-like isoleucine patch superfamily enzyme
LTKARYHAPFPAFLVQQLGNIQPFRWLLGLGIGPRTKTSFFLDPTLMDPWALTIGKNVNIGFGTTITAHIQEHDYVMVDPVVIEDNVMIGAHSAIACGVRIKRGAYVEPFAVVKPGEVIGEGELWAGRPAKKKGYYRFTPSGGNGGDRAEQTSETLQATGQ